ncbi:hypothetical protein TCAL_14326 [Tigriopus californicus]|uniref:Uncharacterized protein n=1 Tax=Tigriopus californicus TaxID=6832 RepID=A0A553NCC4_TIGCA|nr:hypothetical protein TCAL_14326 [Tigriopus californicus]
MADLGMASAAFKKVNKNVKSEVVGYKVKGAKAGSGAAQRGASQRRTAFSKAIAGPKCMACGRGNPTTAECPAVKIICSFCGIKGHSTTNHKASTNVFEVCSLLGLVNQFAMLAPDIAQATPPIQALLKKDNAFL